MPQIDESIRVEAPVETVYGAWRRFEQYPGFVDAVDEVEPVDDTICEWAAGRRHWKTRITEDRPNHRLGWIVVGGGSVMVGLDEDGDATRIEVYVETDNSKGEPWARPEQLRADLERFKGRVESRAHSGG